MESSFRSTNASEIGVSPNAMSGYLYKKSSSGNWQRRYFETNGSHLTYYKTHKMTKLLAALALPQVGIISLCKGNSDEGGAVFQLELKDRLLQLRAANLDDANKWIEVLSSLRDGSFRDSSTYLPENMTPMNVEADTSAVQSKSFGLNGIEKETKTPPIPSANLWKTNRGVGRFCRSCC